MRTTPTRLLLLGGLAAVVAAGSASAQLFENLRENLESLSDRVRVGMPRLEEKPDMEWEYLNEHPKGMAAGDFDGDGHVDWVVGRLDGELVFSYGKGDGTFSPNLEIATPAGTFRQLLAADLNGDGRLDLAGCDPFQGKVYLFTNNGTRAWDVPGELAAWEGVRNLAAGDLNGDGASDLIVAGPDRDSAYDWVNQKPLDPQAAPAQPRHGVGYYQGMGGGNFAAPVFFPDLATIGRAVYDEDNSFPRPVYSLKTWRPAGAARDSLVAAHANSRRIAVLRDNGDSKLTLVQTLLAQGDGIRGMALGPVLSAAAQGPPDLVVANRDLGLVEVFRGSAEGVYSELPQLAFPVPLGPRAIELADLDADGWLDLVAVQRYGNKVVVMQNRSGTLVKSSETPTGWSPRELATADLDKDGRADFLVLNRDSADVSVLLASALNAPERTGFKALDMEYATGGDVAQMAVKDVNQDGRDDVLQLHRLSQEVSVRLSLEGGKLAPPQYFRMGSRPESMSLTDVDNDGKQDLVTTNIGDALGGLYAVRLGDGEGGFGPVGTYRPPPELAFVPSSQPSASLPSGVNSPPGFGALFSLLLVDLDNDGIKDLFAGYYDCRGVVMKGGGDGTFTTPAAGEVFNLTYESRYMVAGDFDQDGDQDLAVAGFTGTVVVLENTGNFFGTAPDQPRFIRWDYPGPPDFSGARELVAEDFNGDGDPDLVSATGRGVQVLIGQPGIGFERRLFSNPHPGGDPILTAPGLTFPVMTMARGLFDEDAVMDLATVCAGDGCLRISTFDANYPGAFREALVVDCPHTDYLQTGDVDGDGITDLVGTGAVLWVALSSRAALPGLPITDDHPDREKIQDLVINEVVGSNDKIPLNLPGVLEGSDGPNFFSRKCDSVELYNGSADRIELGGWKLLYQVQDTVRSFALPPVGMPPGSHRLILAYDKSLPQSIWRTGFRLAKEGGTLRLVRPDGSAADEVTYPALREDTSYARYADGDVSWRLTELPNPGFSNEDGGLIEPEAKLKGVDLASFGTGRPVRFYATGSDDLGVIGMTIFWRRLGGNGPFEKLPLYDDGMSGDGGRLDGVYAGDFLNAPPAGTPVEFYLETQDLSGTLTRRPGPPPASSDDSAFSRLYTLTLPSRGAGGEGAGLEISEMMPSGSTLADPTGGTTNWVEIRNTSTAPIALDGMELVDSLFENESRAVFPEGTSVAPGEHRIVWSRPINVPGALSGDLTLSEKSEELMLVRRDAAGSQRIMSYLQSGLVPRGMAAARIGPGGPVMVLPPTPGRLNVGPDELLPMLTYEPDGEVIFSLIYPTVAGAAAGVEWSREPESSRWFQLDSTAGNGFEKRYRAPVTESRKFFRLRH